MIMNKIEELQKLINECDNIVFLGGAGVSTDSGIKDFRSKNGLYQEKTKFPPEYMLSIDMFYNYPEEFFDYYRNNLNCLDALPNVTHLYLKKLEDKKKLKGIITQNIDGLHTKAGSEKVYEVHGSIYKNHCTLCHKSYEAEAVFKSTSIPKCTCGGVIKPDVVLYGEMLPPCYEQAIDLVQKAEMLIVAGTSLKVSTASNLVNLFRGKYLVIINETETDYDNSADLVIHDNLAKIFSKLK